MTHLLQKSKWILMARSQWKKFFKIGKLAEALSISIEMQDSYLDLLHRSLGESNTFLSAYTKYRHLGKYCTHPLRSRQGKFSSESTSYFQYIVYQYYSYLPVLLTMSEINEVSVKWWRLEGWQETSEI